MAVNFPAGFMKPDGVCVPFELPIQGLTSTAVLDAVRLALNNNNFNGQIFYRGMIYD
jgi:hypothetical protein